MGFTIRGFLDRCGTRRVVLAALAGAVACVAGLLWRQERLGGLSLLDGRGWYAPEEAAALFEALDRLDVQARTVYAAMGLTIDMRFPAAYGLLLALLLLRLFRAPFFLLPLAAAMADALENATVAALALSHADAPSPLARPAAVFTLAKTVLFCAALAAICVGAVRSLRVRLRR